jgi:hypothetical protein
MSRSFRHVPITGITTAASDRPGKVLGHRRSRAAARTAMAAGAEAPSHRLTENPWTYPKDGKRWWRSPEARWLRK